MDISRPDLQRSKRRHTLLLSVSAGVLVLAAVIFLLRLSPSIPTVDGPILTDTVKRGPLLRQVRGPGTLIPREDRIRLIPAQTDATVIRIAVLPGAHVHADTVLMELVDPLVQEQMLEAQLQLRAAQADMQNVRARLQSDLMTQRAGAATVSADQKQAALQSQTDKSLFDLGVISGLSYSASRGKAEELHQRDDLEHQRLSLNSKAIETQLAVQQTKVAQAQALLGLKQKQQAALSVRAGIDGVLVELPHQVGEHVAIGTTLAKVVQPDQLKAALKIAETQARELQIGQPAAIDTHNGIIPGKVVRIDPAVQTGTVTVDVELNAALPQGARPDLSVDGTIDLDRLTDVLTMARPAVGNENSTISVFRLAPDRQTATRVRVHLGKASVNTIEVLDGLSAGDAVILSDMSRWETAERIQLQKP